MLRNGFSVCQAIARCLGTIAATIHRAPAPRFRTTVIYEEAAAMVGLRRIGVAGAAAVESVRRGDPTPKRLYDAARTYAQAAPVERIQDALRNLVAA